MGEAVRLRVGDREVVIEAWPFRVGRADHCGLVVDDPRLGREQLLIDRVIGGWSIAALGPAPVRVNGIQIGSQLVLRGGDRIECGTFHGVFLAPPPDRSASAAGVRAGVPIHRAPEARVCPQPEGPPVIADRPLERGRRFITTGGVSRAHRPPRAPATLAVGMALLVAGATALFAAAVHQMTNRDPATDPRYAMRPIEIASRPAREPIGGAEPPRIGSRHVPSSAFTQDDPEPPPDAAPVAAAPSAPSLVPPAPGRAAAATPTEATADEPGELEPPHDGAVIGAPGGSVAPSEEPPFDGGRSQELRIPILGEEVWGKNVAFVIDRSGSMAPVWIGVRNELVATLRLLTPDHKFSLVLYSNELSVFELGWTSATPAMIDRAIAWTEGVPARGATDPEPAVEHALRLPGIDALVLMSDIRFKGARMDRTVELLTRATRGTKTYKAIKLYFFPLEENESTARISALSSGSPSAALRLRALRR